MRAELFAIIAAIMLLAGCLGVQPNEQAGGEVLASAQAGQQPTGADLKETEDWLNTYDEGLNQTAKDIEDAG